MTKQKLGARETVYDRCAYVGCYNGKFINGRRLFHFPAETDRRLEMWIERSGNFRLRTWAATSLRKAGLCGDHFDEKSFTNSSRKALRRNVVPRHYTEDIKYRNVKKETNNDNENEIRSDEDDPMNGDQSLSPAADEGATEDKSPDDDIYYESCLQSGEYCAEETNKSVDHDRSPSPMVEFIVEELDESLIRGESQSPVGESIFEEEDDNTPYERSVSSAMSLEDVDPLGEMEQVEETEVIEESEAPQESLFTESGLRVNKSKLDVKTYYRSKNHHPANSEDFHEKEEEELPSDDPDAVTDEETMTAVPVTPMFRAINSMQCSNKRHEKILLSLRTENKQLRKTMRLLKQNLRRSKAREAKYMKVREMLKNIDEFLNIQECTNPVARAMVKLALHKHKTPYTKEEKDFATQLYRHSSTAFVRLRRAGCSFPGKSTMKRWIAEDDSEPLMGNFMNGDDVESGQDDAEDTIDDTEEYIYEADQVIEGAEETIEGTEEVVENCEEVTEGAEEMIEGTEEIIEGTEEIIEGSEEIIEGSDEIIEGSEEILEETEEGGDDIQQTYEYDPVEHTEETIIEGTEEVIDDPLLLVKHYVEQIADAEEYVEVPLILIENQEQSSKYKIENP